MKIARTVPTNRNHCEFPPMQKGASFNMEAVKAQIQGAIAAQTGKSDCTAALPVAQADSAALLETVLFPKGGLE